MMSELLEYITNLEPDGNTMKVSDNADEIAYFIRKHSTDYFRLSVFEHIGKNNDGSLYLLSDMIDHIHADVLVKAKNWGYISKEDMEKGYTCYVFPKEAIKDKDGFYELLGDYIGYPIGYFEYAKIIICCIDDIDAFKNTKFIKAMGQPTKTKTIIIDEDDDGNYVDIHESLLNEASGEAITNDRILKLIDDCKDTLNAMGYDIGDDIDYTFGSSSGVFGTMKYPKTEYGNYEMRLNKFMANEPDDALKSTIYHEFAHYIQFKEMIEDEIVLWDDMKRHWVYNSNKYGKSNKSYYSGHGTRWKEIADNISRKSGIKISRTDNYETHAEVGKHYDDSVRYIVRCNACGDELKFIRKTEFVKNPNAMRYWNGKTFYIWQCGNCKAKGKWETIEVKK